MTGKPETVAEDQIAAFVDRILRLKAEADDIAADIKEIYAEAHGNGFNKTRLGEVVTYLRKVEKDKDGVAEAEAIRDLYLAGYYRAKNKPHTHAHARGAEKPSEGIIKFTSERGPFSQKSAPEEITPEHDADGVVVEPQSAPQAAPDLTAAVAPCGPHVGSRQVEPIQPETAEPVQSIEGVKAPMTVAADANAGGKDDVVANTENDPLIENTATRAGASGLAFGSDVEPVATNITAIRQPKPMRPNCLKPDMCGGQGRQHCWACTKAMNEAGAA